MSRRNHYRNYTGSPVDAINDSKNLGSAPVATLDLHGYSKEKAIARMTRFLSEVVGTNSKIKAPIFVTIITGTGSHSRDGPVIRTAVRNLLEKRQMSYVLNKGKGSFTVDANSGIELYHNNGQKFDSKVLIVSTNSTKYPSNQLEYEQTLIPAGYNSNNNNMHGMENLSTVLSGSNHCATSQRDYDKVKNTNTYSGSVDMFNNKNDPLPREVLAEDALLIHVKKLSSSEASKVQSLKDRELNDLQKAAALSTIQERARMEKEDKWKEEYETAIRLSLKEKDQLKIKKDEEELERALLLSKQESTYNCNNRVLTMEEEMQKALSLSLKEYTKSNIYNCNPDISISEIEEKEMEMVRKAIELSLRERSS